ncbi:MAG: hypothetical protein EBS62_15190, partial [Betaproteobacteria bacterium]|nr:hypothetical protein [Betaproteobacteria bacterium]
DLAIALGGVAEQVLRAREVEALLRGQAFSLDNRRAICDELFRSFISMIRCGALADAKESGY